MKVLVTGAGGKLGSNLVRRLTERGDRVRALDRLERRHAPGEGQPEGDRPGRG